RAPSGASPVVLKRDASSIEDSPAARQRRMSQFSRRTVQFQDRDKYPAGLGLRSGGAKKGSPLSRAPFIPARRTVRTLYLPARTCLLVVDGVEHVLRQLLRRLDLAVPVAPAGVRLTGGIRQNLRNRQHSGA